MADYSFKALRRFESFCRSKRDWSVRLFHELCFSRFSQFLTLTYSGQVSTLNYRDMTLFLKRLRYFSGYSFRYFYVGEYGSKTFRPHYHMLIFFSDSSARLVFTNKFVSDCWRHGFVHTGSVNSKSIMYVAGYCFKKMQVLWDDNKEYFFRKVKPFRRMSRCKGIGYSFLVSFADSLRRLGRVIIDGHFFSLPRYYLNYLYSGDQAKLLLKERLDKCIRDRLCQILAMIKYRGLTWSDYVGSLHTNLLLRVDRYFRQEFQWLNYL